MDAVTQPVLDAFPKRPLQLLGNPTAGRLGYVLLTILLFALAGLFYWMTVPSLLQDWQIAKAPVAMPDAEVSGHCTTHFVLVSCNGTIRYRVNGKSYTTPSAFVFVDLHFGDYRVSPVRSADHPELATVDIALNQITNRLIMAVVLVGGCVIGGIYPLTKLGEAGRVKRLRRDGPIAVTPLAVEVLSVATAYGRLIVRFRYVEDGSIKRAATSLRRAKPFMLAPPFPGTKSKGWALAARLPAAGVRPMVINEALTSFDFTDSERQALKEARMRMSA